MVSTGIFFATPNDDAFGSVVANQPLLYCKCAYFHNVVKDNGFPLKTIELNQEQPFTPPTPDQDFTINIKAVNMYNHQCTPAIFQTASAVTPL